MKKRRNKVLKILSLCLAALVIVSGGAEAYLWKKVSQFNNEKIKIVKRTEQTANIPDTDSALEIIEDINSVDLTSDSFIAAENEKTPIYETGRFSKYVTSVLFVVQDGYTASPVKQADAIMLFSYNEATQKISALSMLRDSYVPVEGHGFARISDAYSFGGMGLLINTINDYYALDIQNYAVIGTEEMISIIDHIGGINAKLTKEEADYIGLTEGDVLLDGRKAIEYALDRTSGGNGDFSRTERQRKLISSFIKEMRRHFDDEDGMLELKKFMFMDLETNVDLTLLANLGKGIIKADEIVYSPNHVPFDDCWEYARKDDTIVIYIDREKNNKILKEELYAG